MYFSENPSLNICRQRKGELESWLSRLTNPLQQFIKSGSFPDAPQDEAEAMVEFDVRIVSISTDIDLVQPTFHAPWTVDLGNKAFPLQSVENELLK